MLDRIDVVADDENAVSDAGLLLGATLGERLGLAQLLGEHLSVPGSAGANPARKSLTVIHSLLAGGDCIEDVNALRAGSTGAVLGHRVAASSTIGTFLRAFSYSHARQLDAVTRRLLARAVAAGAHDGFGESVTVDIDSTLCETYGLAKDGARGVMRTGLRGYHPLVAVIAGTPGPEGIAGVVAHARLRRGCSSDATSAPVFVKETINRLRHAGATGEIVLRADSGFYLADVVTACRTNDVRFSITARMIGTAVKDKIAAVADEDWTPIDYFLPGAGVTEFEFTPFATGPRGKLLARRGEVHPVRMIVRRTPITEAQARNRGHHHKPDHDTDPGQDTLFEVYDYHPIITDRAGELVRVEADHRRHAEVELTIRDLKHDMALNHFPTKSFGGNAAWLIFNTIAHNLTRWLTRLGLNTATVMTKKIRRRVYSATGRLVRTARRLRLRLPRRWPWAGLIMSALTRLRALPAASG